MVVKGNLCATDVPANVDGQPRKGRAPTMVRARFNPVTLSRFSEHEEVLAVGKSILITGPAFRCGWDARYQ
jgi:hypothetical protein